MLAKLTTRHALRRCAVTGAAGLALLGAGLPAAGDGPSGPSPALDRFYRQKVAWAACDGMEAPRDLQCGKVAVPVDYGRPGGATLELALARYRATGDKRGSVVLNFGGPGGPGVPELAYGGEDFMGLTDNYDVVGFDPRGVGRSSPVSCGDSYESPDVPDAADEALRDPGAVLRQLEKAADRCARHSGPVLPHIGTVNAARDLDVIRQALGDDRLNYLGFSYGTRLGAVYAAQFPDRVGRLVLDGVDTLTEPLAEQGRASAAGQQTALEDFIDWCVRDIACPFGQDARRAREEVLRLVRSLDEDPVPTAFSGAFTGQDLVGAIGQALYSKDLWPSLERALASLVEDGDTRHVEAFATGGFALPHKGRAGDGTRGGAGDRSRDRAGQQTENRAGHRTEGLAGDRTESRPGDRPPGRVGYRPAERAGDRSKDRPGPSPTPGDGALVDPEEVPLDNLPAALMAINCADDPDRPTAAQITRNLGRLRAEYEQASPVFGRYRLTQVLMCYGRPRGTDYIRTEVKDLDTPRMLLVGTRGDPATPYRWTVQTAKRLGPSAVVLDNKGEGHTGYASSECVQRKVDAFLLYGSLPDRGGSCGAEEDE
ncbi:alpha/beta hydrolase [Streptomyces sp. NPDC006610]|uniref:alpha/beta hydrolase n=1 Tax=Streptomyces sp. NPDC006610 TaxID=3154584 RepID=UPI0033B6EA36